MPNEQKEGLDRPDFMMAAIGLVGASATLVRSACLFPAPGVVHGAREVADWQDGSYGGDGGRWHGEE